MSARPKVELMLADLRQRTGVPAFLGAPVVLAAEPMQLMRIVGVSTFFADTVYIRPAEPYTMDQVKSAHAITDLRYLVGKVGVA